MFDRRTAFSFNYILSLIICDLCLFLENNNQKMDIIIKKDLRLHLQKHIHMAWRKLLEKHLNMVFFCKCTVRVLKLLKIILKNPQKFIFNDPEQEKRDVKECCNQSRQIEFISSNWRQGYNSKVISISQKSRDKTMQTL